MTWGFLTIFIILIAAALFASSQKRSPPRDSPYTKLDKLFSPAERSFLGVLNQVIGDDAEIFGKVRVGDILTPIKGMNRSKWQTTFNKIFAKHFGHILCDKDDLSVLCAIELNDSSHNSKKRQARNQFLEGVCAAAELPLIQINAKESYNINGIRLLLVDYLSQKPIGLKS